MQETRVRSLGREDPLEKGIPTHSSILAWRIPMDRGAWPVRSVGFQRVGQDIVTNTFPRALGVQFLKWPAGGRVDQGLGCLSCWHCGSVAGHHTPDLGTTELSLAGWVDTWHLERRSPEVLGSNLREARER